LSVAVPPAASVFFIVVAAGSHFVPEVGTFAVETSNLFAMLTGTPVWSFMVCGERARVALFWRDFSAFFSAPAFFPPCSALSVGFVKLAPEPIARSFAFVFAAGQKQRSGHAPTYVLIVFAFLIEAPGANPNSPRRTLSKEVSTSCFLPLAHSIKGRSSGGLATNGQS